MAMFQYTAVDSRGKEKKGRITAESEQEAAARIKSEMKLFPTSIVQRGGAPKKAPGAAPGAAGRKPVAGKGSGFGAPRMKPKRLTQITRQLATLLDAGLPLVRALRTLERQSRSNRAASAVLGDLANMVEGGSTLTEALAAHPRSFPKIYVNMVRAGEASGSLETVLNRLAIFQEKAARIKGKVKSAMTYPLVVLFIALSITSAMMIFIVPKFAEIFDDMLPGEDLPGLTQVVMRISDIMVDQALYVLIGIVAFAFMFKMFRMTKVGSYLTDLFLIKVPPVNQLTVRSSVARFCRTLGTLMDSGVAVLQALQIVRDTAGNEVVSRAVQTVHDAVKEGEGMTKPLEAARVFPGMVCSMVEVGEETGALPEMLNRIADTYEEEVDRAVEALTSLIEPLLIIFLAVVVGSIVIALFLPLIKIMTELGG
jgi:type IV pilus assembly protein PilC